MKIIFVGGTGRCGKSVVAECLACHPDAVKLPFELRFLTDPDGLVDFYVSSLASWSPFLADVRIRRLGRLLAILGGSGGQRYAGWQLRRHLPNWDNHVGDLMQRLYDFRYVGKWIGMSHEGAIYHTGPADRETLARILGTFIRDIIKDFLNEHGKSIFISDDTWSVLFARELSEILPEAQFVHVCRDPRDVISSMSRQAWCPNSLEQATQYYLDLIRAIGISMGCFVSEMPFSYRRIRFEDAVISPHIYLVALYRWFGLEFDESILALLDKIKANIGRWKDEADQKAFELVMPLVRELGYE